MEYNNKFLVGKLKEINGNACKPQTADRRTIVVFVSMSGESNDIPGNEELFKVWPKVKEEYRKWWRSQNNFKLGSLSIIQIQSDTELALIVAKKDEYDVQAIKSAMDKLGKECGLNKNNVHLNLDEELAKDLAKIIEESFLRRGVNVYIYK